MDQKDLLALWLADYAEDELDGLNALSAAISILFHRMIHSYLWLNGMIYL